MSISELASTYATLILHDEDTAITADKIAALVKAANVNVESYWPALFARLAEKRNIADLISNVGSPGAGAPVSAAAGAGDVATPAAEEKKKEDDEEVSDEDMGLGLFD